MNEFKEKLREQIKIESRNYYTDNYDYYTFGKGVPGKKKLINAAKRLFFSKPILGTLVNNDWFYESFLLGTLFNFQSYLAKLDNLYQKLETEESKSLLVKIIAFRVLGYVKVKLPLNTPDYWDGNKKVGELCEEDKFVELPYKPYKLFYHNLSSIGFPVKIYLHSNALYTTFCIPHYAKPVNVNKVIQAEVGDVVLDCGGCYGDTALFFANRVGKEGHVYTFEFVPSNKKYLKQNLKLNPELSPIVTLVEQPLWDASDKEVFVKDRGANSQVSFEEIPGADEKVKTISIDDFVKRNNIQKVDFIKTDIEGAEPFMLKGAVETLSNFKPKLAISIYHGMDDFTGIIEQIDSLNLGYKFYLWHATIYSSETVLFCEVE